MKIQKAHLEDKIEAARTAGYRQALIDAVVELDGLAEGHELEPGIREAIEMIRETWGVKA